MRAIYVPVSEPIRRALNNLAEREYRDPRDQAAYFIAEGLRREGALSDLNTAPARPASAAVAE